MNARPITRVLPSTRTVEGAGFVVRRPFPAPGVTQVDPFLLLDEMGPVTYEPGQAVGAPDHPHRGFETVTYVLEGETEHEDSAGHRGSIGAGDVQWMTAGGGIVHSEMPSRRIVERGGRVHGFQLWVNLPARDKRMAPRYQEIPGELIPKASTPDGRASVTVIAGSALGVSAAVETRTPIAYHDWTLRPGARVDVELPETFQGFAFVFAGAARIGAGATRVADGGCALFEAGGVLPVACAEGSDETARVLLLGGRPLGEPIARHGPFVMNRAEELAEAMDDYRRGRLGRIAR